MKRTLYFFIGLVLPLLSFGDDDAGALFTKGNAYYARAQYKEAVAAYQEILNNGYQSAAVYFNMGNASFKNGDIASSIWYYEKAHKLSPGDEDINANIRFANLKTTDKIDEVPEFFLARWWKAFMLSFSLNTFSVLSVILILLASGIFVSYLFSNSFAIKKYSFYLSVQFCLMGIMLIFIANRQLSYFSGHQQAIIFNGAVNVKSGPGDKLGTLFVIHDGTKVNVLDNTNGWLKIRLANGNEGWMKQADAKLI